MKNKHFIVFVAMLMIGALLLTACSGNHPTNDTKTTEESGPVTPPEKPNKTSAELQAYYDRYFGSEEMHMAGTAIQSCIRSGDACINTVVSEGNFEVFVGDYGLGMYMKDGYMYLHIVMRGENDAIEEEWYRTAADEQKFYSMTNEIGVLPSDFDINTFTGIQYMDTKLARDCWTDIVKVTLAVPVNEGADDPDEPEEEPDDQEVTERLPETTEEEYVFYIDAFDHAITSVATSRTGTKLNDNNELVTEVTVVECWFLSPVAPYIPADVAFEEVSGEEFEETFGFALLAVLLLSLA